VAHRFPLGPGGSARLSYAFLSMTPRPCLRPGLGPGQWRAAGAPLKPWRNLSQIKIAAVVPEG
jgi:hypothetical protein